jgi:hypothetical protein
MVLYKYPESGDKPSTLPEVSNIYPTVLYHPREKRQENSGEDGEASWGGGGKRETRDGTSGRFGAFGAADRGAGVSRLATEVGLVVSQLLLKFLETNGFDWI